MAHQVVFHFPDRTEIRYLDAMPQMGEAVSNGGVNWVVTSVEERNGGLLCTLAPSPESNDGRSAPEEASEPSAALPHSPSSGAAASK